MCPSLPVPSKPLFIKTVLIAGWSKISDFEVGDQNQTQTIVWWPKIHFSGRKIVHFIQLELFPYTTCYIAASVPLPLRPYLTRHITKYAAIIWLCQLLHAFTNWNTPPWVTWKWNSNEWIIRNRTFWNKKKKYGEERTLLIPFSGPREFSSQAAEVLGPKLEATSHRSRWIPPPESWPLPSQLR